MEQKVFVTRPIPEEGIALLTERGYAVEVPGKDKMLSKRALIRALQKHTPSAVISLLTDQIDSEVFDAAPSVRLFVNFATGFDNIDVAAANKRGVQVANAPAPSTSEAVAEHTIALMLSLAARIVEADDFTRRGKYKGWSPMLFIGTDVLGKTLGVIGAGRIGTRVVHYARGLGMQVLYHDVSRNQEIESEGAVYQDSIDTLLRAADIVSLHVPLNDTTRHLINAERLSHMKPTAFLINTARGGVIDEAALTQALSGHSIAGAGLDVFEHEPYISRRLRTLPNVILTPHIASASQITRREMALVAAHNVIDSFEGRPPRNRIIA